MARCRLQHSAGGSVALWPPVAHYGPAGPGCEESTAQDHRLPGAPAAFADASFPHLALTTTLRLPLPPQTLCTHLQSCRIPTLSAPVPLIASCCPFLPAQRLCLRPSRLRRSDPSWRACTSFICQARCVH